MKATESPAVLANTDKGKSLGTQPRGGAQVSSQQDDANQPQGNQFRSDDSQQESRNHPAVGAVPVPTPPNKKNPPDAC
jgi:hypothetical protein